MPLQCADASPLAQRPAAALRLAVTVWIPKASTALLVHAAPPSRVSVCTQMSAFPPEIASGSNGSVDMSHARLYRWTDSASIDGPIGGIAGWETPILV